MARTQGKGWFRTRRQTKDEFVYFCCYSQDPATGNRTEKIRKLYSVSQFPDVASRWKEVGRLGLSSLIEKPISALTFRDLVDRFDSSGANRAEDADQEEGQRYCSTFCGTTSWTIACPGGAIRQFVRSSRKRWRSGSGICTRRRGWRGRPSAAKSSRLCRGSPDGRKEGLLPADFDPFKDIDCEASKPSRGPDLHP